MKPLLLVSKLLCLAMLLSTSCGRKELEPSPLAVSDFTINNYDSVNGSFQAATYLGITFTNNSSNAVSYKWDFGNGSSSSEESPTIYYPKSGVYKVTLTVKNKDSVLSTSSRNITIFNRVIKQIRINDIKSFNYTVAHDLDQASGTVWAVVRLGDNGKTYAAPQNLQNETFNTPILLQTPTYPINGTSFPILYNVTSKTILDYAAINTSFDQFGYKGVGYGLELYGKDASGTYLQSTSYDAFFYGTGGLLRIIDNSIRANSFIVRYLNVDLICDFEL